ncbi:MAG: right-handed parallel beta-helix repeat-containing protein [Armatimonadetes bacterium]|nr:right-handed parallel beta-helix repeat-containing protein [Armatimonadota bacterium]
MRGAAFVVASGCLIAALVARAAAAPSPEVWVAPSGSDAADGSRERPLRTLEAGRDALRKLAGGRGGTLWLRGGRYSRTATFDLSAQDSGVAGSPMVVRSAPGERAVLDGGVVVPAAAWTPVTDAAVLARLPAAARTHALALDLRTVGVTECGVIGAHAHSRAARPAPLELALDGRPQQMARFPNAGEPLIPITKVVNPGSMPREGDFGGKGATIQVDTPRISAWITASDPYVAGIFNYAFSAELLPVASLDPALRTVTTALPSVYSVVAKPICGWYITNLLEEIDVPGEYYVDRTALKVYWWPPKDLAASVVQVSVMETPMVALQDASNVVIRDLTVENTRGTAIYVEGGSGCTIGGCLLRNLGLLGVQLGRGAAAVDPRGDWPAAPGKPASRVLGDFNRRLYEESAWDRRCGTGHTVTGCDIMDAGAGGVLLGGGDRRTLKPGNNAVENCRIERVARWGWHVRPHVSVDGVGNRVSRCLLSDSPGQAVMLFGNDHVIEGNDIGGVCTWIGDGAAIYMGRDPSACGYTIRGNYIHDLRSGMGDAHGVQAIYIDDSCVYTATIEENVFVRAGSTAVIKFNGGGGSAIRNNLFVACPKPIAGTVSDPRRFFELMEDPLGVARTRRSVDIRDEPYRTRYPALYKLYVGQTTLIETPAERNFPVVSPSFLRGTGPGGIAYAAAPTPDETASGFKRMDLGAIGLHASEFRSAASVR